MSWIILLVGIAFWIGAHLFKRVQPEKRAALGDKGRGMIAAALFASILLMILGYRMTPVVQVWYPPSFFTHINNVLMLLAVFLFFVGKTKGRLAARVRHPMLTAVKVWALAHLLANGDLASILLFGAMMGWAVSEVIVINRDNRDWTPPETTANGDVKAAVAGAIFYIIVVGIHVLLGLAPLG